MKARTVAAIFWVAALFFPVSRLSAQANVNLRTTEWKAYGLQFKAPVGFVVEDDTEDGYIISTRVYYITLQLLEGIDLKRAELADELRHVAEDDEVTAPTPVKEFELPQFYGVYLKGNCETDQCLYCYLLDKEEGSGFYLSIIYQKKDDKLPDAILKSFRLVE